MNQRFEGELIEALAALEEGQPLEQLLAQHGEAADRLRSILKLAGQLEQASLQPSTTAKSHSRERFLAEAVALHLANEAQQRVDAHWRWLTFSLTSLAVLLLLLWGALPAARTALPGDPLYGLKIIAEDTQMALTRDRDDRLELRNEFGLRRVNETLDLLAAGREAEVVLGGDIESWENGVWLLNRDGQLLKAHLDSSTVISGTPKLGLYAHVEGRTVDGQFVADLIAVSEEEHEQTPDAPEHQP